MTQPVHPVDTSVDQASQDWRGRKVLVTGGTSGTGFEVARQVLHSGADVVVVGRDPDRGRTALQALQAVRAQAPATAGQVHLSLGDCADHAESVRVVSEAVATLGGLDVLVSAGARGVGDPKPFAEMTAAEIHSGLNTRFLARVHPVHAAIEHLKGRQGASIVLLTTDAARHATRGESIVGAYAAAVIAFTKTLARELSRDRIRVNSVAMTLTSGTHSWESIFGEESYQKELFSRAVERFPFGRPPSAAEVADAVIFLGSSRAAQVSGQTLSVNGGLSYGGW